MLRSAGDALCIVDSGVGAGSSYAILNNYFENNSNGGAVSLNSVFTTTNQVYINGNVFYTTSGGTGRINLSLTGAFTNDNVFTISNNLMIHASGGNSRVGISIGSGTSATSSGNIYNNTILMLTGASNTALNYSNKVTAKNNILSAVTGASVGGTGTLAMSQYTADTASQALGTGSITITNNREFCETGKKYFLSPMAQCRNSGISITGVTKTQIGINGIMQGNSCTVGNSDMGCNPYSPALCGGYGVGK
jgi:hypothetical protein